MDERLANDHELYYEFVSDIFAAGMIGFTADALDIVTPFFVKKKDGMQRLVWDARVPNRRFQRAPPMAM
eukprot:4799597-Karenia_brevis.AAC.1